MNEKFFIQTFGCQMNVADSRLFSEYLEGLGYTKTENPEIAQIIIVNTCTVRQHAEDRALSFIGELKNLKEKGIASGTSCPPNGIPKIIVAGCVAERLGEKLKKNFPFVDLIVSAKDVEFFPEIFEKAFGWQQKGQNDIRPPIIASPVSEFVTITRGCNNFCSYCIVPYVRGPEKYRPLEEILSEIEELIKKGIKEVTLLGQNVNSYISEFKVHASKKLRTPNYELRTLNYELRTKLDFADLLTKINQLQGLKRIRFLTSHPKDFTDKIIDAVAKLEKVCKHIHLPLQSGSNKILELMNRKYTIEHYLNLIEKIRNKIPDVSITTDLMVGFPGETENDFNETLNIVKKIQFDFAYVFKYSPREKTNASKLKDDVPTEVKIHRHKILLDTCNKIANEKSQKLVGKTLEVLVESKNKYGNFIGKTQCNRTVIFNSEKTSEDLIGQSINVKILSAKIHSLSGIPC
ncbi:MAG: tRNA (N6-isopentenyl adenosine(37)-C2)-methylthiotransferase MiaB [Endomicrobiia bacterium]